MQIYEEVQHLITSFLDGHDVCIFSYGQTGSGKTYTMGSDSLNSENEANKGIIPRAVKQIIGHVGASARQISVQFQEIYLDSVRDLLDASNVLTHNNQSSKYEPTTVAIQSADQVFKLLKKAEQHRSVASTACNQNSSRSHSIFQVKLAFPTPNG